MKISISDHFDYKKLIRFVLPSMGMMVFTSIYSMVDGYFVSNYAGSEQFAAINLVWPFLMIFNAIGFMIGSGGTALVSMKLGEKKEKEANEIFSLLIYFILVIGLIATLIGYVALPEVSKLLGADKDLLPYAVSYGRVIMIGLIPFMLQSTFQSFLVVAERPNMGFALTVAAGLTNMFLDFLLVGVIKMGVVGAALATILSQVVGGLIPLVYFAFPNKSILRLGKTRIYWWAIWKTCSNGISEFLSNVSASFVSMLYNLQLLKLAGNNGVAAYGVIMYVSFIFVAIFCGYAIGTAPIVGYNYGAKNDDELKNIFAKSLKLIGIGGVLMTTLGFILSRPLAELYVGYDSELMEMTVVAFEVYSFAYLIMGYNIFSSSFFTALSNGPVSAFISFMRTIVFQVIMVYLLPVFLGVTGVWMSVFVAECGSLIVSIIFLLRLRGRYHYF